MPARCARHERRAGILFSLPVIVLTAALLFLPIVQTFYYSLTTWDGINSTWIGLDNYQRLVSDSVFWRVLLNNMFLLVSIPFALLIPLVVAFLLHQHVMRLAVLPFGLLLPHRHLVGRDRHGVGPLLRG